MKLDSKKLTIEIPSEKTIKSQELDATALAVISFIVTLPIHSIFFSVLTSSNDYIAAQMILSLIILHLAYVVLAIQSSILPNIKIVYNLDYLIHFIFMIPVYLIIFLISPLAPLVIMILHFSITIGITIGIPIRKFLEPSFFIERSFKVYEHTRKAEFFIKNNRWYLALFHKNGIEIYDVQKGNIVIQQEGDFKLFSPYDTLILTYFSIVENRATRYIIKLWDINTYKSVFSCVLGDMGRFFLSKNKKYLLCCNTTTEEGHEYDEGYWSWTDYYYDLKIWEIKTGLVIYDNQLSVDIKGYSSAASDQEIKTAINKVLKSYKEVGELDELDESYQQEKTPLPYPIAIIFPSGKQNYNGYIEYDMTKVRQSKFTEKATYIRAKIPLKELR